MEMSYDIRGDTHIKRFKIYKKKRSANKEKCKQSVLRISHIKWNYREAMSRCMNNLSPVVLPAEYY